MGHSTMRYGLGTELHTIPGGFGGFCGGRAICADGHVRAIKRMALTADTFFSVPAQVSVYDKTVTGFITMGTAFGHDVQTDDDPSIVLFVAYTYGKNGDCLPEGSWRMPPIRVYKTLHDGHVIVQFTRPEFPDAERAIAWRIPGASHWMRPGRDSMAEVLDRCVNVHTPANLAETFELLSHEDLLAGYIYKGTEPGLS